jgi:hypothetical protein
MYCPNCGLEIRDKYNFCPKCGFQLEKILPFANSQSSKSTSKAYSVKAIRQTYKMAYEKWSASEDAALTEAFHGGLTVSQLAEKHQRKKGAVQSRIAKLGLTKVSYST